MKRICSLVLALILCLSLCACGGRDKIRQEAASAPLLEEDFTPSAEYDGNIYRYTGLVCQIKEDYVMLGYEKFVPQNDMYYSMYVVKVYLEPEELAQMKDRKTYTVAGEYHSCDPIPELRNAVLLTGENE